MVKNRKDKDIEEVINNIHELQGFLRYCITYSQALKGNLIDMEYPKYIISEVSRMEDVLYKFQWKSEIIENKITKNNKLKIS